MTLTLRLLIEKDDGVLPVCRYHAVWLDFYAAEDPATRILDRLGIEERASPETQVP